MRVANWLKISFRLLRHELKRGELTIMAIAIAFSVASVLSLSVFSERLQAGILAQSSEFLAADRVLRSRQEIPVNWIEQAREQGLQSARRTTFNSMVFAGNELALADIKAVSDEYPLRGTLEIADQPFALAGASVAVALPRIGDALSSDPPNLAQPILDLASAQAPEPTFDHLSEQRQFVAPSDSFALG